jgi:hypothetical protein
MSLEESSDENNNSEFVARQGMLALLSSEFKPIFIRNEHQRNLEKTNVEITG